MFFQTLKTHSLEFLRFWTPQKKWHDLAEIDRDPRSYTLSQVDALKRMHYTAFVAALCLLGNFYFKSLNSVEHLLLPFFSLFNPSLNNLESLHQWMYYSLLRQAWWVVDYVVFYGIIPALFIRFFLKEPIADFGWRWNNTHQHLHKYIYLLIPIMGMAAAASYRTDFTNYYPSYRFCSRSGFDWLAWESCYVLQFIFLEFFFRGFLLNALRPAIGGNAVWFMVLPYLMIHFGKPWLESAGSIFFGLFLGILALQNRSIWGGFMVHCGLALSMDVAALIQKNALPSQWLP
ncbi:MAG: hypothetical protein RL497_2903 [Pseudomonadota bacterium]|jgi:hypothetical protein